MLALNVMTTATLKCYVALTIIKIKHIFKSIITATIIQSHVSYWRYREKEVRRIAEEQGLATAKKKILQAFVLLVKETSNHFYHNIYLLKPAICEHLMVKNGRAQWFDVLYDRTTSWFRYWWRW